MKNGDHTWMEVSRLTRGCVLLPHIELLVGREVGSITLPPQPRCESISSINSSDLSWLSSWALDCLDLCLLQISQVLASHLSASIFLMLVKKQTKNKKRCSEIIPVCPANSFRTRLT